MVGPADHVLDFGLEVVCNVVGDFSDALQPLICENIGTVLRDSHEVVLKRVHCVRPGLQMIEKQNFGISDTFGRYSRIEIRV